MRKVLLIVLVALFAAPAAFAATGDTPLVKITPPASYWQRKLVRFPLELPAYVLKAVAWPIGATLDVMQRKHAIERIEDFLSNKDRTLWIYPVIEGGAGSSFGGGPALRYSNLFNDHYKAYAYYKVHINMDMYAGGSISKKNAFHIGDMPVGMKVETKWARELGMDYYGIGATTSQNDHAKYEQNVTWGYGDISFNPFDKFFAHLAIGGDVATSGYSTYNGGYPNVDVQFPQSQIEGYGRWISYLTLAAWIARDSRDSETLPTSGGRYAAGVRRFQHIGSGSYDYNEYQLDLIHYFPMWKPGFIITLHNNWTFEQETGGGQVPFYKLATLDASNLLRGFDRGRFHDTSKVVFNVQCQYPLWKMLDGVIFYDAGRVFHGAADFSFTNFRNVIGGGLNLTFKRFALFHIWFGYGGEGVKTIFGVEKLI